MGHTLMGGGVANAGASVSSKLAGIDGPAGEMTKAISKGISFANDASVPTFTSSGLDSMLSGGAADFVGNGSLLGKVGETFQGTLGSGSFADALGDHTGTLFGAGPLEAFQTISNADGFSEVSKIIGPEVDFALNSSFGSSVSALQGVIPTGGTNFLGEAIADFQGVVTNGLSSVESFVSGAMDTIGTELSELGELFNVDDITNFGNPGQFVNNVTKAGGAGITGIEDALVEAGLDTNSFGLSSSVFNNDLNNVLSGITGSELIENAGKVLNYKGDVTGFTSMADFSDFAKVMPKTLATTKYNGFDGFRDALARVDLGQIATPENLGKLIKSVATVSLPTIINKTDLPVDSNALAQITQDFLGGSGTGGSITLVDMIGSMGGVGINNNSQAFINAYAALKQTGELNTLETKVNKYDKLFSGDYGDVTGASFTDPDTGVVHATMDSFVSAVNGQIDSELSGINSRASANSVLGSGLSTLKGLWNNMQKKISDEITFQGKTDLQLDSRNSAKENAYFFQQSLDSYANDLTKSPLITGMIDAAIGNGDVGGEYMRVAVTELQNQRITEPNGIIWRSARLDTGTPPEPDTSDQVPLGARRFSGTYNQETEKLVNINGITYVLNL